MGDSREEPGDINNSQLNQFNTNNNNSMQNLQKILKSTYFFNKNKFIEWLIGKKLSKGYIRDINNVLDNTLKLKFNNVLELRDELLKVKNRKYRALALRNLLYKNQLIPRFSFCFSWRIQLLAVLIAFKKNSYFFFKESKQNKISESLYYCTIGAFRYNKMTNNNSQTNELHKFCYSVGENWYHVVLVTQRRRRLFQWKETNLIAHQAIDLVCKKHNISIFTKEVMNDHVHLFVTCPPEFSIRKLL